MQPEGAAGKGQYGGFKRLELIAIQALLQLLNTKIFLVDSGPHFLPWNFIVARMGTDVPGGGWR